MLPTKQRKNMRRAIGGEMPNLVKAVPTILTCRRKKRMGKERYINKVIISHEHWSIKGSENHDQTDMAVQKTLYYSGRDQQVFNRRKELGFPKERITND